jgi:hypothetical protein
MQLHDDIHNFYEQIVVNQVIKRKLSTHYTDAVITRFCCTALSPLPPRNIHYAISPTQGVHIQQPVTTAINMAN